MRKKLKKMFDTHWNCLPWFVCGLSILIKGDIGRWAYGLTWVTVLVMTWHYCPTVNIEKLAEDEENKNSVSDEEHRLGLSERICPGSRHE